MLVFGVAFAHCIAKKNGAEPLTGSTVCLACVPFVPYQHIDVFDAVSVSHPVLNFVIAASAMPDRSPIDFRALCDDQRVLWSSWVSYVYVV